MTLIEIARLFLYVREAAIDAAGDTNNTGLRVEAIQHWSGGEPKDSYCAEMAWMWMDLACFGKPPVDRFQSCEAFRQQAIANGWIVTDPAAGDLALSINTEGLAHHIALVTVADPLTAIAGNTSEDGISANGTGVFEHAISAAGKVFVRIPGLA